MSDTPTPPTAAEQFDAAVSALNPAPEPIASAAEAAPEPGKEPAAASPAQTEAADVVAQAAATGDAVDLAALPPAVRAHVERMQNELTQANRDRLAALGRLAPAQKEAAELKRRLASLQPASSSPTPASAAAPAAAPVPGSPKWDAYAANFPEEAAALLEREQAQQKRIAELEAQLTEVRQLTSKLPQVDELIRRDVIAREAAKLSEAHPDWQDLVYASDPTQGVQLGGAVVTMEFAEWLAAQDEDIQAWYGSDSATKNIRLFDAYKRDRQLADRLAAPEAPEPTGEAALSPEETAALRAHERRTQARAASVAPDLRGQAPAAARVDLSQLTEAEQFDAILRAKRAGQELAARRHQLRPRN